MVDITIDLVRKRSEHNEGEISTLEELSLHQEDIIKIDHLQYWCRDLKILLLQSNLISRIENVWKFKKLEYLNLALNNIEIIENLEGCESLQKLDLTLNFIGELTSVQKLRANIHLDTLLRYKLFLIDESDASKVTIFIDTCLHKISQSAACLHVLSCFTGTADRLYLTGNPCCDYTSYRNYVIGTLTQLKHFDNVEIERSERIQAMQVYEDAKDDIIIDQSIYRKKRIQEQKIKAEKSTNQLNEDDLADEEKAKAFWASQCDNSPETRIELARQSRLQREIATRCRTNSQGNLHEKRPGDDPGSLFWPDGRARNLNQAQLKFVMQEDEDKSAIILDVAVYRFLDTSFIDVDVEPTYVRVVVKGKILQLVLPEEVHSDKSTAERSQTTGHLIVTMPMLKETANKKTLLETRGRRPDRNVIKASEPSSTKRELLEIGPPDPKMDFSRICEMAREDKTAKHSTQTPLRRKPYRRPHEKEPSNAFHEDPQVPPLE